MNDDPTPGLRRHLSRPIDNDKRERHRQLRDRDATQSAHRSVRRDSRDRSKHTSEPAERTETVNRNYQPSEGVLIYVLGLVLIATRPGRFWLGFALAIVPVAVGTVGKLTSR